jgi:hypothetical protein
MPRVQDDGDLDGEETCIHSSLTKNMASAFAEFTLVYNVTITGGVFQRFSMFDA